ncbi:MAG: hypothetical protein SLAVMIC_00941 [uncultured marine phage]|uniref:DUF6576 domain-containing protein n=1 Tax=uncultured marine phage TaxID=707152 RepID=A0A8D9FR81_9VIRU|nr:MAG: hypothetical protein SLAVMIC_00941 [uncultured marine phage]
MNTIKVTREQVEQDFPHIYEEFVENLRTSNSLSRKINLEEKSKWFYTWGSFVKKAKTDEEKVLRDLQSREKFDMEFPARLELELSKIRVTITMEAGKFMRADRARKHLTIPESIVKIITETTKLQVLLEQKEFNNQTVIDSVPPIDEEVIPKEQVEQFLGESHDVDEVEELDIDTILEKISAEGMASLTDQEKEFLDNQSQG